MGGFLLQDQIRLDGGNPTFYCHVKKGNESVDLYSLMPLSNPVDQGHQCIIKIQKMGL